MWVESKGCRGVEGGNVHMWQLRNSSLQMETKTTFTIQYSTEWEFRLQLFIAPFCTLLRHQMVMPQERQGIKTSKRISNKILHM